MKKVILKFLLRNIDDIIDFFSDIEARLQEFAEAEGARACELEAAAKDLQSEAETVRGHAKMADKLRLGMPTSE